MCLNAGAPVETFALKWTAEDERRTGAKIGEPGSQALWEAYMMLRCLWLWVQPHEQGYIRICGDAQGVLAALVKNAEITLVECSDKRGGLALSCPFCFNRSDAHMERAQ